MNINDFPKISVGTVDTPLEYMPHLTKALGKGKLYIKRDDLSSLALGGNKTRKLDYLAKYALDNGYTTLMTFGGVQTNHGRLTVATAIKCGLKSILVLNGAKPAYLSGNLLLNRLMDTEMIFVDTTAFDGLHLGEKNTRTNEFLKECTKKIIDEKEAKGEKVLNIPIGGQGVIGAAGYIQAVPEIMRQMKEQDIDAKFLVVSYGSTGTFAGLWAGAMHYKAPFKVIGIPVLPNYPSREDTANFINEISQTYEMSFRASPDDVEIAPGPVDNRYFGVEYNVPDSSTWEYIQLLARTEAIFLDPCYTGKGFHGFVDMVRSGVIPAEEGAIFINTGGTPGLWTKEHLDFAQSVLWTSEDKITVFKAEL